METGYGDVVQDCGASADPMGTTLDMHPLDPPPPDVLLALLARNKALEGEDETYAAHIMIFQLGKWKFNEQHIRILILNFCRTYRFISNLYSMLQLLWQARVWPGATRQGGNACACSLPYTPGFLYGP
ncbi:unnamed protein product, partial [Iphiclides podalirius]